MISPLAHKVMLTDLHHGGANGRITRVVMHATVSPCKRGGAEANALYFQSPAAGGAAHYIVDPGEIVCSLDEDTLGFHAPPNAGSIGIELCDPQTGDSWADADHQAMLALAAELAADICARHQLPVVWLSPSELLAGDCGITSHANVAQAWHKTDHTDPGQYFPVDQFIASINGPEDDMTDEDRKLVQAAIDAANNAASIASDIRNLIQDPTVGVLHRLESVEQKVDQPVDELRRNVRRVGKAVNAVGIEGG